MSIIESIRNFIMTCPYLKNGVLGVDFLGKSGYAVEAIPSSPVLKKYADGGTFKQFRFYFTSREKYGADFQKNIENSRFYENFSDWLKQQNELKNLPVLESGRVAQRIDALSDGFIDISSANDAKYKIECRLIYFEK